MLFLPTALNGMEFLGSTQLGSAAATTSTLTIPARDVLLIIGRVTGYGGGGDVASLRFNGDTGTNYNIKFVEAASSATAWTLTNSTAQTLIKVANTSVNTGRIFQAFISNLSTVPKVVTIQTSSDAGAGAAPNSSLVYGQWNNSAAQITSIVMLTAGGANLNANTGFAVYGQNL